MSTVRVANVWGWEQYFNELIIFLRHANRNLGTADWNHAAHIIERLQVDLHAIHRCLIKIILLHPQICVESLTVIKDQLESDADLRSVAEKIEELVGCCRQIEHEWESYIDTLESSEQYSYQASVVLRGRRGRPRFVIQREQLLYLASLGFSWTSISSLLGVSRMTVYRRRMEYDLLSEPTNVINDDALKDLLREIKREHPYLGQTMILGLIRAQGYYVSRERLRDTIKQIDPLCSTLRWHSITYRRQYRVPSPNALWHIGMKLLCNSNQIN